MNTYTVKLLVKDSEGARTTFFIMACGSIINAMREINKLRKKYDILDVHIEKDIV